MESKGQKTLAHALDALVQETVEPEEQPFVWLPSPYFACTAWASRTYGLVIVRPLTEITE